MDENKCNLEVLVNRRDLAALAELVSAVAKSPAVQVVRVKSQKK